MSDRQERRRRNRERQNAQVFTRLRGKVEGGRVCVLNLFITKPDSPSHVGGVAIRAVIDTGATHTAIRPDIASQVGLPIVGSMPVSTASTGQSSIECSVALGRLWLGNPIISSVRPITVMPLSDQMLFGMDALVGGVLTVDMVAGEWNWEVHASHVR